MVVCQQQCLGALLKGAKVPIRTPPIGRFMAMDENRHLVEFRKVAPDKMPQKQPSQWIPVEESDKVGVVEEKKDGIENLPRRGPGRPRKAEPVAAGAVGQQV